MVLKYVHMLQRSLTYFFADDSVLFPRANLKEVGIISSLLKVYENVSSQMINLQKSEFSCSRNVPSPKID